MARMTYLWAMGLIPLSVLMSPPAALAACSSSPKQLSINVSGAIHGDKDYYAVYIPDSGSKIVTITGSGATPCLTRKQWCFCKYKHVAPDAVVAGNPIYTFNYSKGWQQAPNKPVLTMNVGPLTTPGEYQVQLTKVEQDYKPCKSGYSGGVTSLTNTQASRTITVLVYRITHTTAATTPSDRTRNRLGVAEDVNVTFRGGVSPDWVLSGGANDGTISATSGAQIVYTAGAKAASPTLTAKYKGISHPIKFTVVEPKSITGVKTRDIPKTRPGHTGMEINLTVTPTDVCFSKVFIKEIPGPAENVLGYYQQYTAAQLAHDPTGHGGPSSNPADDWHQLNGNNGFCCDTAEQTAPAPWSAGSFDWVIPSQWTVDNSSAGGTQFVNTVTQAFNMDASGNITITKFGETAP